jgi:glucokinase
MRLDRDQRVVLTLDAGGTKFAFSAMQAGRRVVEPITLASRGDDLNACLANITQGFKMVVAKAPKKPVAISFAFPGPADYPNGVIGDLNNLPGFRGGVALGPMIEAQFGLPVFINNDGDLFAYGEALQGLLPEINQLFAEQGSARRYKNLFGVTLGTGFGGGIVRDNQLFLGDNAMGAEIWLVRNKLHPLANVEESVSIRAVRRVYGEAAGMPAQRVPEPKTIYAIARGELLGDKAAAIEAFRRMGQAAGDALANAMTLIDGLVVIGGGLSGAAPLFLPELVAEMNRPFLTLEGKEQARMETRAFNLEDPSDLQTFLSGNPREIHVPGTQKKVRYDSMPRIGVGISRLGTSHAIAVGAYAFALQALRGRA